MDKKHTEACAQAKDEEEQSQWKEVSGSSLAHGPSIRLVLEGKNDEHQNCAIDKLGKELVDGAQEGLWIGAEDASRSSCAWGHCTNTSSFISVNGRIVIGVHDPRSNESAKHLGHKVSWKALP